MRIRNTATAIIAAAGLSVAALGAFAAGPASAATASARHHIKHPIRAVAVCSAKGQFGWTSAGQRFLCTKPPGWRHYRWVRDPIPAPTPPTRPVPPAPPVPPGPTAEQQLQTWALATGNDDWSQVFLTDTAQLATDEGQTPTIFVGPAPTAIRIKVTPLVPLQATITTDANALVTDATAALAAPPPGNFTASWDAIMNDQVAYGNLIAGDPGDWGAYTYSQPDANAAFGMAATDSLTAIEAVGITVPPVTTIVAPTANQVLDNAVIEWNDGVGIGQADFLYLVSHYPVSAIDSLLPADGANMATDAAYAQGTPPPGNLTAPWQAVANDYAVIGAALGTAGVTVLMTTTLATDLGTWDSVLASDGSDVSSWINFTT
jgi:hypothetical protein